MVLSRSRIVAPRKAWHYGRIVFGFLVLILIVVSLSVGPMRTVDLFIRCRELLEHLWKH
jgi:hypothetical protein